MFGQYNMADSITRKAMAYSSKHAHDLWMKELGWKRKQPHLYKQSADLFYGCNFQASQWGSATSGKFTINLVVTWPSVYSAWTSKKFPKNPGTAIFPIQVRIGMVKPGGLDKWWEVSEESNLVTIADQVSTTLRNEAHIFFEKYPNQGTILQHLREGIVIPGIIEPHRPLIHAIMADEIGKQSEAKAQINNTFKKASGTPFQKTVMLIEGRIGIHIE